MHVCTPSVLERLHRLGVEVLGRDASESARYGPQGLDHALGLELPEVAVVHEEQVGRLAAGERSRQPGDQVVALGDLHESTSISSCDASNASATSERLDLLGVAGHHDRDLRALARPGAATHRNRDEDDASADRDVQRSVASPPPWVGEKLRCTNANTSTRRARDDRGREHQRLVGHGQIASDRMPERQREPPLVVEVDQRIEEVPPRVARSEARPPPRSCRLHGIATRHQVANGDSPRSRARSNRSFGQRDVVQAYSSTNSGDVPSSAGAISGIGVSVSPSQRKTLNPAHEQEVAGTMSTTTHKPTRKTRDAAAAGRSRTPPTTRRAPSGTTTAATSREFTVYRASGTTSNTSA